MDKLKIPWIECIITLEEQVEENFNKLISIYKKNSRSKKKLKKKLARITTNNTNNTNNANNTNNTNNANNANNDNLLEFCPETNSIVLMSDEDMFSQLALLVSSSEIISGKLENKIINYIDFLIKKYMNVYIHTDDKTLLISEKNKANDKIFLKFYFPQIINNGSNGENNVEIENRINKFGDNIHFTVLPEVFGHGGDGMFHLTFRIESRSGKPIYEYSKYISFNVVDDKVGIVLYDDEKGNNAVVFRISENLDNLSKLITCINNLSCNDFDSFIQNNSINTQVYKDICLYIALDIFKKLFKSKKIDNFFTRHLNSFGLETIYKMINKLLSILLSTFLDLYSNSANK
jgi:hypothetical protein